MSTDSPSRSRLSIFPNFYSLHLCGLAWQVDSRGLQLAVAKKGNTGATVGNDRCHWARTSALPGVWLLFVTSGPQSWAGRACQTVAEKYRSWPRRACLLPNDWYTFTRRTTATCWLEGFTLPITKSLCPARHKIDITWCNFSHTFKCHLLIEYIPRFGVRHTFF